MTERRLTWLAGFVLVWGAAIFGKLVSLQVLHYRQYRDLARSRQELVLEVRAPRGTIYDRTGSPLAMSVPVQSVYVNPLRLLDLKVAASALAACLHMDEGELHDKLKAAVNSRRGFLWIKRRITPKEADAVREAGLDWIETSTENQRHYPKNGIASHVLGSVDFEERGNAGIEKFLDAELRGQAGHARLLTDVKRRGIEWRMEQEGRAGMPITLTIDERIQYVAERELALAVEKAGAERGSMVAMNPNTGEILAMASYPTYNPNLPPEPGEQRVRRQNQAIEAPFEPGSVFKVITLTAGLETTTLRPESPINCGMGRITLFGRTIHDTHSYGVLPMAMVLAKSSNVGAIQVGMRVGEKNLRDYIRRFGFGQRSGVQLPAESPGRVRRVWGATSLGSVAMGQEVSVTTLQLAQACSVVANGGLLVHPRLVLRKGRETVVQPPPERVLKPETAITMKQMMEGVVMPGGTGTRARLVGYSSAGKTGSAQIYSTKLKHFTHNYNATFMGFAPVTNPAIVIVVTLNGTHGTAGFGGMVSAPVFQAIATEALRVLDVPKDVPDQLPLHVASASREDDNDLAIADLGGNQKPLLQEMADEDDVEAPQVAVQGPAPFPPPVVPAGPKVPDFKGKSMRAVLAEAAAEGLPVVADGSGIARMQTPRPGTVLRQGERIRVQFAR